MLRRNSSLGLLAHGVQLRPVPLAAVVTKLILLPRLIINKRGGNKAFEEAVVWISLTTS
jgi:hypothetical protein